MKKLQDLRREIERRPIVRTVLWIVCAVVGLMVVAHILLLIGTRHFAYRTVPQLTGIPLEEARSEARRHGLRLHVNDSLYVPAYAGGTVLDQLPEGEVRVKPGRTVYVTINAYSRKIVPVPYVAGRSLRQAKNMLEMAGLGIKELVYRPDMATNYVLEQRIGDRAVTPSGKLRTPAGTGVTLYVGENGYVTAIVPAVLGTGADQARGRLWEQGFNVGAVAYDEGIDLLTQKDARVYTQSPAAGTRAHVGAKVSLRLTLDQKKAAARSGAAEASFRTAVEEQQRLDAERKDSLARAVVDSLMARPQMLHSEEEDDAAADQVGAEYLFDSEDLFFM